MTEVGVLGSLEFSKVKVLEGRIFVVTLNRPQRLNALHRQSFHELARVWDYYEANPDLWVAILTGEGRAFCAGFDLKAAAAPEDGSLSSSQRFFEGPASGFGGLVKRERLLKPIIAAVNGIAHGGGFELALACDIVVAGRSASFALPEPRVGLAALAGGLQRLPRVVGYHNAMSMILTGRSVTAQEGYRLGFVQEVANDDDVLSLALKYAKQIIECSPDSIAASKKCVIEGLKETSVVESMEKQANFPEVKRMLEGQNLKEGITSFNQKKAPKWKSSL